MSAIPRFLRLMLFTVATVPASAQSARNTGEPDISLTLLGTGAPRPSLKRYGPGILVETDKHRLLVDAGSGLRERVYQAGAFDLLTSNRIEIQDRELPGEVIFEETGVLKRPKPEDFR